MYVTQSLHRMAQRAPDALAAVDAHSRLTWRELRDQVSRFVGGLRGCGVVPGDRVALLARNGTHFLEYILGTLWAGAVINPVNLRWTPQEIAYSLSDCDTRVLLVAPEFEHLVDELRALAPGLRWILSTGETTRPGIIARSEWFDNAAPVPDAVRRGGDLAAVMYTGGTTGRAKGVMLSHTNLACSAMGTLAEAGCAPVQVFLHSAPLFHIGGLSGLLIALVSGTTCVFIPGFEPVAVLHAIVEHRVTDLFLVPTMLRMLLDHPEFQSVDTSCVQGIRYGAAPIDDHLLDRAMQAFPNARFSQAYGMTELSPTCTLLPPADHTEEARAAGRGRSAGRATRVCEVRIVGADDAELPRGQVGEIAVRGPTVMQGYWGKPEATAEVLRGGWMHTGDLGWMDEGGYITVVDRLKDMIITGGENVYSAEVENALSTHPAIAALAVIGLPDPKWGERVHAVIVLRPGNEADEASIDAHCRSQIAGYKCPRSYEFVAELPLSGAGKVLKNELRAKRSAAPE